MLTGQNDFDGAATAYREAIRRDEKSWIARFDLGQVLLKKHDTTGAVVAFREAVTFEPNNPSVYNQLALALCSQGEPLQGLQVLRDGVKANPAWLTNTTTWVRYNLACCAVLATKAKGPQADVESSHGLRGQALDWLTDDLAFWRGTWQADPTKNLTLIHQRLSHWLEDTDLAAVRESSKLPEVERPAWQKLWDDVRKLHEQTDKR